MGRIPSCRPAHAEISWDNIVTDTLGPLLAVLVTAATCGLDGRPQARGQGFHFTPIPKRWAVERTYGWLMLHRRLARDYETLPARSEAVIHIAMADLMTRRLTSEKTVSWRDPKMKHRTKTTS